ncbi:hypothetical protein RvY_02581 [Ramazzottius varieornatus]|uniref:Uncharacterized protein n=1 Tax=Ramazzottius varieornatus TaxID=947166 RepID=A0A1D1UK81_RAMVA|nr:hypothetical protein RvY_02581 [Ramazzottius varieornatus]
MLKGGFGTSTKYYSRPAMLRSYAGTNNEEIIEYNSSRDPQLVEVRPIPALLWWSDRSGPRTYGLVAWLKGYCRGAEKARGEPLSISGALQPDVELTCL